MKFCTKCGAELKEGAKFCTSCGTQVMQNMSGEKQVTSKNTQITIDTNKMKQASLGYWSWIVPAWKRPYNTQNGHVSFGLVTFGLEALLGGLSFMIILRRSVNGAGNFANQVSSIFGNNNVYHSSSNPIGFGIFFTMFLSLFLSAIVLVFVNLVVKKIFSHSKETFLDMINDIAHKTSWLLLGNALIFLLSLIVTPLNVILIIFMVLLLFLMTTIWSLGLLSTAFELDNLRADRIYAGLTIYIVDIILYLIIYTTVITQYASQLGTFFNF